MSTTNGPGASLQTSAKPPSLFSKIGSFFKHAEVDVAKWFEADFGPEAHTFATGAEALLETQLGQIAQVAVQNAEKLETSQEKWSAAGEAILAAAEQAGLQVSTSLKNLLIELAVQKLDGTFATTTA
jgi:hypothetical protein